MVMIGEKPWVKFVPESNTYGRFIVEPLERGYGATLGNSLRRVLLSSLSGAAVTSIRIDNVSHEFAVIPNVKEDTLQIILNIKEIVIKSHSDEPKVITLKVKGRGEVTAAQIEHDNEIEIINKDKHIATLEDGAKLSIEMTVEKGKGFVSSEDNKKSGQPIGTIPVDSIFTPVLKVNLSVEEIRVGREINYDKLVLDVWTNGAIAPDEAVKESAKILAKHIDMFIRLGERAEALKIAVPGKEEIAESTLEMSIEDLELSARSSNCLKKAGVKKVSDLIKYSAEDLMKFKNFGLKSLNEVNDKLSEYKLTLKGGEVRNIEESQE